MKSMKDALRLQQEKYYGNHKQYKVYLSTEEDADIIAALDKCKNRSLCIRNALILYFKHKKGGAV